MTPTRMLTVGKTTAQAIKRWLPSFDISGAAGATVALSIWWIAGAIVFAPTDRALAASTLIEDARVVDGTGASARTADVRIEGDRIVAVGSLSPLSGEKVVPAAGRTLAPGFIDTHSHGDGGFFERPDVVEIVSQGITTIVVGQDGFSHTPLDAYFRELEEKPGAVNVASYSGHNTLRRIAMGADASRTVRSDEIEAMTRLLEADMRAGAIGLSTGLEYDTGVNSTVEEVLRLATVAARHGGRYASHIRSEDRRLWEALEEAIEVGRQTGAPVQISHMKLAMVDWWGQAPRFLAVLDRARAEGVEVTGDVYPYEYWQSVLTVMFPERRYDHAGAAFALEHLAPPDGLRVSAFPANPSLVGKTVAQIAAMRGTDPPTTLLALIAESSGAPDRTRVIATAMSPADVAALLAWPNANVTTDGGLGGGHPRAAGSFTRVLREYVREKRALTLEEAVRKMTSLPANSMGFADRGVIRPGAYADLVLFDPEVVADRATTESPRALSVGIDLVWVNGVAVFEKGRATGAHPGRVLRRAH